MRLAVLSLLVAFSAHAEEPTEMYMPNDSGGFLVLTLEPCAFKEKEVDYPNRAYATESSELVKHEGCWVRYTDDSGYATFAESMVNTWWGPGLMANFRQKLFSPKKERWTDDKNPINIKLDPIVVKPNT